MHMSSLPCAHRVPSCTLGLSTTAFSPHKGTHTRAQGSSRPPPSLSLLLRMTFFTSVEVARGSLPESRCDPLSDLDSSWSPPPSTGRLPWPRWSTKAPGWTGLQECMRPWYGMVSYSEHWMDRKSGSPSGQGVRLHRRYLHQRDRQNLLRMQGGVGNYSDLSL